MSVFIAWWLGAGTATVAWIVGGVVVLERKGRLQKVIDAARGR